MSKLQEILAAKAEKGDELNSAETEDTNVRQGEEGFEDTPEEAGQTIQEVLSKAPTAFALASSYEVPVGSFRNIRLHSVVLKDGTKVKPNVFGYYENPEGELKELLKYYESKGLAEEVTE